MIETATCTDLKQQWGKLKASTVDMYAPVPLSNFFAYHALSIVFTPRCQGVKRHMYSLLETATRMHVSLLFPG